MKKVFWISCYRSIRNPDALAAYAKLAGPAIEAGGGRFMARGMPVDVHEAGLQQRVVVIEFDSLEKAQATYSSSAYKAALDALGDGAERDIRIVEAM